MLMSLLLVFLTVGRGTQILLLATCSRFRLRLNVRVCVSALRTALLREEAFCIRDREYE